MHCVYTTNRSLVKMGSFGCLFPPRFGRLRNDDELGLFGRTARNRERRQQPVALGLGRGEAAAEAGELFVEGTGPERLEIEADWCVAQPIFSS